MELEHILNSGFDNLKITFHHNWKNGRKKDKNGYIYLRMPDYYSAEKSGYVSEHIYNFQEKNKCCMLSWAVIHHIDSNRENNMIWNLEGMTRSAHRALHNKRDLSNRKCLICQSNHTTRNYKNIPNWFVYKNGHICHTCYKRIHYDKNKRHAAYIKQKGNKNKINI